MRFKKFRDVVKSNKSFIDQTEIELTNKSTKWVAYWKSAIDEIKKLYL